MSETRSGRTGGHHHHHHHRHQTNNKMQAVIWAVVLAVCILGVAGISVFLQAQESQQATEVHGDLEARFAPEVTLEYNGVAYGYRNGRLTNILIIGIDQRDMDEMRDGIFGGGQADFLLLLSIDRENKRITPIQLDRDTITRFEARGVIRETFLCTAQAYGSTREENCENTVKAVRGLLKGIPIDYYLAMDMAGINDLNEALGGVTVTVPEDMSNLDPALQEGVTITLKGDQAETFVRSRKHMETDRTNVGRMRRQRVFLLAAADRFTAQASKSLDFVNDFLARIDSHLVTNIPRSWIMGQLQSYLRYERMPIVQPTGEHRISEAGYMEFYPDDAALTELVLSTFFDQRGRS